MNLCDRKFYKYLCNLELKTHPQLDRKSFPPPKSTSISYREIAKLANFGSAKKIKDDEDNKELRGTVLCAASESIIHQEYQPESDIWALWCTVLHTITGKSPWKVEKEDKAEDVLFKIGCSEELPKIPGEASKGAKNFPNKCLIKKPKVRWTADKLLSHPFVGTHKLAFPRYFVVVCRCMIYTTVSMYV